VSRRNKAVKRPVPPDPRYDSQTVSKFVNNLMFEGKKSVAEGIFYSAMDMIEERTAQPGVSVFKQAVNNAKPTLEVKSRRVGGASLQVPVEVRPRRARTIDLVQATAQAPSVVDWQRALRVAVERPWPGSARAQTLTRPEWWQNGPGC